MSNGFMFFKNYLDAAESLSDAQFGKLVRAMAEYAMNGKVATDKLDTLSKALFTMAKPSLESSAKNVENGKKGGRPKHDDEEKGGFEGGLKAPIESKRKEEKRREEKRKEDNIGEAVKARLETFFQNSEILRNKPFTFDEQNKIVQKLVILGKTEKEQLAIINQSIDKGWRDLYPLKKSKEQIDEEALMAEYGESPC